MTRSLRSGGMVTDTTPNPCDSRGCRGFDRADVDRLRRETEAACPPALPSIWGHMWVPFSSEMPTGDFICRLNLDDADDMLAWTVDQSMDGGVRAEAQCDYALQPTRTFDHNDPGCFLPLFRTRDHALLKMAVKKWSEACVIKNE